MNGSPDPDAEQERVRRLLADLAHTDHVDPPAVPDDVAARLERTLAGLSATGAADERADETADETGAAEEPDEEPDGAPVVALGERRAARTPARGRLGRALVAAAAVAVVAGGTAVVVDQVGTGTSTSDSAGSGADGEASSAEDGAPGGAETYERDDATDPEAPLAQPPAPSLGGTDDDGGTQSRTIKVPAVSESNLAADVTRLLAAGDVAAPDAAGPAAETALRERLARRSVVGSGCAVPDPDRGAATFVVLDGEPAVLVVGPVSDMERRVEVLGCAEGDPLAQTQVPAAG